MAVNDVIAACEAAGFTEPGLATAVAIAGRESGWDAAATDDTRRYTQHNQDGTWTDLATGESLPAGVEPEYSVGPFQIDLLVHTDITEADARDYAASAKYAFVLSRGGTDFSAWSTAQGLAASMVHAAQDAIAAYDAAQVAAAAPPPPPDPTPVNLDEAQSTVVLNVALGLVAQGEPMQIARGPQADQVTLSFTTLRTTLFEAWADLATVLPQ